MPSFWFITPAWRRYEISKVCFEQREWACEQLRAAGIDAHACVIADDENLDIANELGCATVKRSNRALGAKFNVGYEFAASQGIDYVCPIGSDSWVDPAFIIDHLPDPARHVIVYSRHYAVVRPDGRRRAQLLVAYEGGTTMFMPTGVLRHCGWRPIAETAQRGCDGQTIAAARRGGKLDFEISERHLLETCSFQTELQVTNYENLIGRWGKGETRRPFHGLTDHYPAGLVDRMRQIYRDRATSAPRS